MIHTFVQSELNILAAGVLLKVVLKHHGAAVELL